MDTTNPSPKIPLAILQFILPVALAMVAGYASVRYAAGENQQKILEMDRRVMENRADVNKMIENQITRREMQLYIEQTRQDLMDIKTDLRELRKR